MQECRQCRFDMVCLLPRVPQGKPCPCYQAQASAHSK